jgi:hypothetical protein
VRQQVDYVQGSVVLAAVASGYMQSSWPSTALLKYQHHYPKVTIQLPDMQKFENFKTLYSLIKNCLIQPMKPQDLKSSFRDDKSVDQN